MDEDSCWARFSGDDELKIGGDDISKGVVVVLEEPWIYHLAR